MKNFARHRAPVWGPKSNFIIRANLGNYGMPGRLEQLWARQIGNNIFEICCIPFFTYGIALGDKVKSNAEYTIEKIIKKTGHKTLRVAVVKKEKQDQIHIILHEWVDKEELLFEWYSSGYLAVDLPPDAQSKLDISTLEKLREKGDISFEIDE